MKAATSNGIKIEPQNELIQKLKRSDDREVNELTRDIWNI